MQVIPQLTRNQWLWLGGAVALGVTEVVSAPIAVALAALPVLDNIASNGTGPAASGTAPSPRRSPARRNRRRRAGASGTRRTAARG